MIVTITPNPSVDRTISLARLCPGEVQRAATSREDAGGKGINVSRALTLNGSATTAVLPVGGHPGQTILALLAETGVPVQAVPVRESIRANVALVEPDGTTTKINELGPHLDALEAGALDAALEGLLPGATWVVACGSLPRGLGEDHLARLVARCHEAGVRVAVDSSGEPMARALAAAPTLVKPNRVELEEVVGRELPTVAHVVDAARDLLARGIEQVLVSLGRDGALLVTGTEVLHARAVVERPVSTVGAGDATLAGYLHVLAAGGTPEQALSSAVAFGAAAVSLPGSQMPGPADVAAVHVELSAQPDPDMPLRD